MNLLEMFKQLTDEERRELIKWIIKEINKAQSETKKIILAN